MNKAGWRLGHPLAEDAGRYDTGGRIVMQDGWLHVAVVAFLPIRFIPEEGLLITQAGRGVVGEDAWLEGDDGGGRVTGRRVPSAALVMGWERLLVLLEVPLARPAPAPAPEGGAPAPPQPTPPPVVTRMWEVEAPVVGLSWMEGPSLALLCEHGPRTILLLYDSSGAPPLYLHSGTVLQCWHGLQFYWEVRAAFLHFQARIKVEDSPVYLRRCECRK